MSEILAEGQQKSFGIREIPKSDSIREKNSSVSSLTSDKQTRTYGSEDDENHDSPFRTKKALLAWLLLCYSTGPTAGVAYRYIPAVVQSAANTLGHKPGSSEPCEKRGNIQCVVPFGVGEVDYNSYTLYLQAIGRACEGIVTIFVSGVADFGHFRKSLMLAAIILFGALALPFAGLPSRTYHNLINASALWVSLTTIQGVYNIMESSYIPIFMREYTRSTARQGLEPDGRLSSVVDQESTKQQLNRGTLVSVLGLVSSNVGTLTALLIGVIILYTSGTGAFDGYKEYLQAITIAGFLTIVFATIGAFFLPSVRGSRPTTRNLPWLAIKRWVQILRSITKYPEAFKMCLGWILWFTANSNFNSVISLLFRETTGLGTGDRIYTVYTFMTVLIASLCSLTWMFVFRRFNWHIKNYAYIFLSINFACMLWGCIGISDKVAIGYKHVAEFWVEMALFAGTSSALRSCNRVMYASMLPKGREAHFFGLELTLDLATGWINPLVQGVIQSRTHNLRYPMLPSFFLLCVAIGFYVWVDLGKGMKEALMHFEAADAGAMKASERNTKLEA